MTRTASEVVYKICHRESWARAQREGSLAPSADDARDGFIHLSTRAQLEGTLQRHFSGQRDLLLLAVHTARLPAGSLRWEVSRGGEHFPHLYGPLDVGAVRRVMELQSSAQGHCLPDDLEV
jgi:uncharacterized protein (DUF952 family)